MYKHVAYIAGKKGMKVFHLNIDNRLRGEDLEDVIKKTMKALEPGAVDISFKTWYMGKYLDQKDKKFEAGPIFWFDPSDF